MSYGNNKPKGNWNQPKEHEPLEVKKGVFMPIMDMKGKPYMQVAHRIAWFRLDHKNWTIETKYELFQDSGCIAEARILDEEGRLVANDFKTAKKDNSMIGKFFIEKAITGAIGRALGLCGYGTQHEPEFDVDGEDGDLADSPAQRPRKG